jgi:hypothetical protein
MGRAFFSRTGHFSHEPGHFSHEQWHNNAQYIHGIIDERIPADIFCSHLT